MKSLHVSVDVCVIPIGVDVSISDYIVACQTIFKQANLSHTLHAFGTNVEGNWEDVFNAIKDCHTTLHKMGAPRLNTTIKCGTRIDKHQTLADKVLRVKTKMND